MPTIRRTLKNVVKNYSDAQVKVREATSNDPWGPSSTLMSEIADLTYNVVAFTEIMQMVWKRLNDDGKNWRHVYKSLMVLDYIIKTGSEKVAQQCKENFHAIKTLTSFQYIDLDNKDQGMNVREKAKQLVALLSDDERLKNERAKSLKAKERFAQNSMGIGSNGRIKSPGPDAAETHGTHFGSGSPTMQSTGYPDTMGGAGSGYDDLSPASSTAGRRLSTDLEHARPSSVGEEELQLQLALAMSKEEHEEEVRKQKSDDIKLQMAINESRRHADDEPPEHPQKNAKHGHGSHTGARETTDPWGMPLQNSAPTDPWGAPLAAGAMPRLSHSPQQQQQQQDVWVPPVPPVQSTDPWTVQSESSSSRTGSQPGLQTANPWSSPQWGTSPPASQNNSNNVNTVSSPSLPATNGTNNIDDAFDLLSSRSAEGSPSKSGAASAAQAFDPLASTSENSNSSWNMEPLNQSLPERKKSPLDFLGAHTGLVNLDELVSKEPTKGNNPFTSPATNNPFEVSTSRVPMSQLQNTQAGFSQPVSAGLLPTPLIPLNTTQQVQAQPQGYNPFL
ncbi:epsin-2-like [Gigantopelta aegis]|uniref:epsin-2-like n=1 Tax=Gigantopelta aegis TaxID=1735272 RepID=UPI001B88DF01|nr:epsin-2-like [Gigantopelta aegis]